MSYEKNQAWLLHRKCPKCGDNMEQGYITGHWFRLRWNIKAKTKTVFSGIPLMKKLDWFNAPTVRAARCDKCKIGIFIYDN